MLVDVGGAKIESEVELGSAVLLRLETAYSTNWHLTRRNARWAPVVCRQPMVRTRRFFFAWFAVRGSAFWCLLG